VELEPVLTFRRERDTLRHFEDGLCAVGGGPETATNRIEDDWQKFDSCG
jgi:hypothetical protein